MSSARWACVLSLATLTICGVCRAAPPADQERRPRREPADRAAPSRADERRTGPEREPGAPAPGPVDRADLEMRVEFLKAELARHERALELARSGANEADVHAALTPPKPTLEGPDGPGPGPAPGARGPDLPWQEIRERVLALIKSRNPAFYDRLQQLAKDRPALAEQMIRRLAPRIHELGRLQKEDPDLFDIRLDELRADFDLRHAAMEYSRLRHRLPKPHAAPGPTDEPEPKTVEEAVARITAAVERRYDVALREKQHSVAMLAERLERIRAEINRAGPDRDAEIKKRVDDMIARLDRDPPGRGAPGPRPGPESERPPRP